MIPTDLAARLRLLVESSVQPLPQVRPLPSDLPEFARGQRFTAQIQSALPDGSFRALVAGKSVTLSLEQAAKAGDTLELVVVERTPRAIAATLAGQTAAAPPAAAAATLSRAAQLIGALLTGSRDGAPEPAVLARGQALLTAPPQSAAQLVPLLKQAAVQSGLFYESHQAQWVAGRMPLAALLQEPQGRLSPLLLTAAEASPQAAAGPATAPAATAGGSAATGGRPASGAVLTASSEAAPPADEAAARPGPAGERAPAPAGAPPRDLVPIVQQQLDALATHHLAWQGQVWPGQTLHWEIEEPLRERGGPDAAEAGEWRTTVRVAMPLMGEIAATLTLTPSGVALALDAAAADALARLRAGAPQLEHALAAAGVPLRSFTVERHEPA